MGTSANSALFWVVAVMFLVTVYLLPTLIGVIRGVDGLAVVFLVNLIGAPTGIGWLAALILAFGPRRLPPEPPLPWRPDGRDGPAGLQIPATREADPGFGEQLSRHTPAS